MTHAEVKAMVEEMGLPYAYDHFAEGESPDPPFICFLYPKAANFTDDCSSEEFKRRTDDCLCSFHSL